MAAAMKPVSLSKSQKKVAKKQQKNRHTLFKRNSIVPLDFPTHHLVVANGGLDNNVSLDDLQSAFSVYGDVVDVVMQPQKSYAFVSMSSARHAEAAYAGQNGHPLVRAKNDAAVTDVILYLDYVDLGLRMPSSRHPPGLILLENFVTEEEETILLESIKWEQTDANLSSDGVMKHRRVKHYGYEFLYGVNNVDRRRPLEHGLPPASRLVTDRLSAAGHGPSATPDQLTVNQYQPGQGIPPHVDTHSAFEDGIVSLSLGSQCVMDFGHPDGATTLSVVLPRRSALVMAGESRYMWTHGITPRCSDIVPVEVDGGKAGEGKPMRLTLVKRDTRTSFTFRKIRDGPCTCKFAEQCDSQQMQSKGAVKKRSVLQVPNSDEEARQVEREHVHKVYEEIAEHFSDTRHTAWPQVAEFLNNLPEGAIVVDVGCGNGKYLGVNKAAFNVGCDRSAALVAICRTRGFPVFVADALHVPLRPHVADVVISIAVIHHLSTQLRRQLAVEEIVRVLRPGGHALIYVWAMEQEKDTVKSNYLKDTRIDRKDCLKSQEEDLLRDDVERVALNECGQKQDYTGTNLVDSDSTKNGDFENGESFCTTKYSSDSIKGVVYSTHKVGRDSNYVDLKTISVCDSDEPAVDGCVADNCFVPIGGATGMAAMEGTLGGGTVTVDGEGLQVGGTAAGEGPLGGAAETCVGQAVTLRRTRDLHVHVNRTHFENQDLLVPWHSKPRQRGKAVAMPPDTNTDRVVHRFYHVFEEGELESLCLSVNGVGLIKSYYDKGNWCVIIKKVAL